MRVWKKVVTVVNFIVFFALIASIIINIVNVFCYICKGDVGCINPKDIAMFSCLLVTWNISELALCTWGIETTYLRVKRFLGLPEW